MSWKNRRGALRGCAHARNTATRSWHADVMRFLWLINADEAFGTHRGFGLISIKEMTGTGDFSAIAELASRVIPSE